MIDYWTAQFHRGYTVAQRIRGYDRDYVAMRDGNTWFEDGTLEAVKAQIDAALDEA